MSSPQEDVKLWYAVSMYLLLLYVTSQPSEPARASVCEIGKRLRSPP